MGDRDPLLLETGTSLKKEELMKGEDNPLMQDHGQRASLTQEGLLLMRESSLRKKKFPNKERFLNKEIFLSKKINLKRGNLSLKKDPLEWNIILQIQDLITETNLIIQSRLKNHRESLYLSNSKQGKDRLHEEPDTH